MTVYIHGKLASQHIIYSQGDTFNDLPNASECDGQIWVVKASTGIIFVNRKRAGLYVSDGSQWTRLGEIAVAGTIDPSPGFLPSNPPSGKCVVTNLFVDPSNGKLTVEYNDELVA